MAPKEGTPHPTKTVGGDGVISLAFLTDECFTITVIELLRFYEEGLQSNKKRSTKDCSGLERTGSVDLSVYIVAMKTSAKVLNLRD